MTEENKIPAVLDIDELVKALPEVYQPIFGHPELSIKVSRQCDDRLAYIINAYHALSEQLGRPLRVLDLGCAQGYISLRLAEVGALVAGFDFLPANVDVCRALAAEHPEFAVRFGLHSVEAVIVALQQDQYDLVLGLSVFHHLIHAHGASRILPLFKMLAERVTAGIFELALAEEPISWAAAQPKNIRSLLMDYACVHELARIPTHLSDHARPLFFASSSYWYLSGKCQRFTSWKDEAHDFFEDSLELYPEKTRRYYVNETSIAKIYLLDNGKREFNVNDLARESKVLKQCAGLLPSIPRLIASGAHEREAWLVRDIIPGELLIDVVSGGKSYDAKRVIGDVLDELCLFEEQGLYHTDIRLWNVLLQPDGSASLIDFASLQPVIGDFCWPHNTFLAFWILVWCIVHRKGPWKGLILPPLMSPAHFPEPYRSWSRSFWKVEPGNWTFRSMRENFIESMTQEITHQPVSALETWMSFIEQYMQEIMHVQHRQLTFQKKTLDYLTNPPGTKSTEDRQSTNADE